MSDEKKVTMVKGNEGKIEKGSTPHQPPRSLNPVNNPKPNTNPPTPPKPPKK